MPTILSENIALYQSGGQSKAREVMDIIISYLCNLVNEVHDEYLR